MKRFIALLISVCIMMIGCSEQPTLPEDAKAPTEPTAVTAASSLHSLDDEHLKLLFIGNSFSADTVEYIPNIAKALGYNKVMIANLYIGGASINKHYTNMLTEAASYEYHVNLGGGWFMKNFKSINDIGATTDWDWICIQHGSADGSKYASEGSYRNLKDLVAMIKEVAHENTRIAFNMTWVGEIGSHEELKAFGNNVNAYYKAIAKLTSTTVAETEGIELISPTGTSVQNARTADIGLLTRDGYHLSLDTGRYLAGLTFMKALTGADISDIPFAPDGVPALQKAVCIEAAENAVTTPFAVTESTIDKAQY